MTPIELSTRRRVTGLTSDEFARLFVSLQREVDGEAAQWSARLYHTIMPVTEDSLITAYSDDITFWGSHPDLGGVPHALWNIAALQAAEWARKETGITCELDVRKPLV